MSVNRVSSGGQMNHCRLILILSVAAALTMGTVSAHAQSWAKEQLEVWSVVQAQWKASMEKDSEWTGRFLHQDFLGWYKGTPAPRSRTSTANWNRLDMEDSTTLLQELIPLGIVIHGNTAVAHYVYSQTNEDNDGKRKTLHGRYTDVLVKDGDSWLFLSWHGGADSDDD